MKLPIRKNFDIHEKLLPSVYIRSNKSKKITLFKDLDQANHFIMSELISPTRNKSIVYVEHTLEGKPFRIVFKSNLLASDPSPDPGLSAIGAWTRCCGAIPFPLPVGKVWNQKVDNALVDLFLAHSDVEVQVWLDDTVDYWRITSRSSNG